MTHLETKHLSHDHNTGGNHTRPVLCGWFLDLINADMELVTVLVLEQSEEAKLSHVLRNINRRTSCFRLHFC